MNKKTMFAVSALCAAVAFQVSAVESDVVGYQNLTVNDTTAGGCSSVLCTIPDVGATLTATTLADFKITPPEGGLTGDQSVWLMTFDTLGQINGDYCYLDEANAELMGVDPGWYTKSSVIEWSPESAGGVNIVAGEMFQILSDCGATITVPSPL